MFKIINIVYKFIALQAGACSSINCKSKTYNTLESCSSPYLLKMYKLCITYLEGSESWRKKSGPRFESWCLVVVSETSQHASETATEERLRPAPSC